MGRVVVNFETVLRRTGWGSLEWINLAQDGEMWRELAKTLINIRVF
jgi:hypothetical protein